MHRWVIACFFLEWRSYREVSHNTHWHLPWSLGEISEIAAGNLRDDTKSLTPFGRMYGENRQSETSRVHEIQSYYKLESVGHTGSQSRHVIYALRACEELIQPVDKQVLGEAGGEFRALEWQMIRWRQGLWYATIRHLRCHHHRGWSWKHGVRTTV